MTYIFENLGLTNSPIKKSLVKNTDSTYIGLLVTKKKGKTYELIYEGHGVPPFNKIDNKLKLKEGYSMTSISNFDYVILKNDLMQSRTLEPMSA